MNTLRMKNFYASEELRDLKRDRGLLLFEGVALSILGVLTMAFSVFSTVVTMVALGIILLLAAGTQLFRAFSGTKGQGFWGPMFAAVLYGIAGILVLRSPAVSAVSLTFLIAPLFMAVGIQRAVVAVSLRFPQWGWSLVSGIAAFVVGVMIWNQWPVSGLWLIGTLVGIEFIFAGVAAITLAVALKHLPEVPERQDIAA